MFSCQFLLLSTVALVIITTLQPPCMFEEMLHFIVMCDIVILLAVQYQYDDYVGEYRILSLVSIILFVGS